MVNSISFRSSTQPEVNNEQRISTPQFRSNSSNSLERVPEEDGFEKKDNSNKNMAIGLSSVALLGGGFFAGRAGLLGKGIKKFLKGATEKAAEKVEEKAADEVADKTKNISRELVKYKDSKPTVGLEESINSLNKYLGETEQLSANATESEIKAAYRKAAKNAQNQNNQEALTEINAIYQDITAGAKKGPKEPIVTTSEKAVKEAEEKAKLEAEKAAKEAQEKLKAEYTAEMDKIAQDKAVELKNKWNRTLDNYASFYNQGFESISRQKEVTKLEDGTYRFITKGENTIREFYSKNGKDLDSIRVLDKDGNVMREAIFGRDKGKTGDLWIFDNNGNQIEYMDFSTSSRENGDRLVNWHINNGFDTEGLKSLYIDGKKVNWNALPPKEVANGLGLTNWINLK